MLGSQHEDISCLCQRNTLSQSEQSSLVNPVLTINSISIQDALADMRYKPVPVDIDGLKATYVHRASLDGLIRYYHDLPSTGNV